MKRKFNLLLVQAAFAFGLTLLPQSSRAEEILFSDTLQFGLGNWVQVGDIIYTKDVFPPDMCEVTCDYMSLSWSGAGADYWCGASPTVSDLGLMYADDPYRGDGGWAHFDFQLGDIYEDSHLWFVDAPGEGFVRNVVVIDYSIPDAGFGTFWLLAASAMSFIGFKCFSPVRRADSLRCQPLS